MVTHPPVPGTRLGKMFGFFLCSTNLALLWGFAIHESWGYDQEECERLRHVGRYRKASAWTSVAKPAQNWGQHCSKESLHFLRPMKCWFESLYSPIFENFLIENGSGKPRFLHKCPKNFLPSLIARGSNIVSLPIFSRWTSEELSVERMDCLGRMLSSAWCWTSQTHAKLHCSHWRWRGGEAHGTLPWTKMCSTQKQMNGMFFPEVSSVCFGIII